MALFHKLVRKVSFKINCCNILGLNRCQDTTSVSKSKAVGRWGIGDDKVILITLKEAVTKINTLTNSDANLFHQEHCYLGYPRNNWGFRVA